MSDTLQPHRLYSTKLIYLQDCSGRNTGVGCHFLLQGTFPIQESNSRLLHLLHRHWATEDPRSSLDDLSSRLEIAEKRSQKTEETWIESTNSKNRGKLVNLKVKMNREAQRLEALQSNLWALLKGLIMHIIWVPEGENWKGQEKNMMNKTAKSGGKLSEYFQTQEWQKTSSKINTSSRHNILRLLKVKN